MYKAVIFDLDGTLLNTLDDLADAGNHVLSVLGYAQHPVEEYKTMVGNGVPKLVERFLPSSACGGSIQQLALQMFVNYYGAHSADKTAPYSDIMPLLQGLRQAGVRLGVVSNKENTLTQQVVARYFPDMFDAVTGHVLGTPTKPDPHAVNAMCEAFGFAKEEVLYVGDSNVDIETAHNAQLPSCGVLWGFRSKAELIQAGASCLAASPKELARIISRKIQKEV